MFACKYHIVTCVDESSRLYFRIVYETAIEKVVNFRTSFSILHYTWKPTIQTGFCLVQVDAATYYGEEESRLTSEYHSLLNKVVANPLDIAFVTFSNEAMAKR